MIDKLKKLFKSLNYYFNGIYQLIDDENLFLMSSAITFNLITCIIPLILIIFSVIGNILTYDAIQNKIYNFIENTIPYPSTARYIEIIIEDRVNEFIAFKNSAGFLGAIGLFITASSLFNSLSVILNKIYEINKRKNFILAKLRDIGLIIITILLLSLYILIVPLLELFIKLIKYLPFLNIVNFPTVNYLFVNIISFVIVFLIFYLIYTILPYKLLKNEIRIVSAFTSSILWTIAKLVFGYYLIKFASFNKIYGTYAVFVIVVFWVYYTSMILVIGASIGHLYDKKHNNNL